MDLGTIRDLFRHMAWADALVWRATLAEPRAASDSVVRHRLFHIHFVQRGFLAVWRDPSPGVPDAPAFTEAVALAAWGRRYHEEVAAYLDAVDALVLDEPIDIPWAGHVVGPSGRPVGPVTRAQTMLQVASHSTHHRGQVNARLRDLGSEPPLTDFIVWLWLGKPAPVWPALDLEGT